MTNSLLSFLTPKEVAKLKKFGINDTFHFLGTAEADPDALADLLETDLVDIFQLQHEMKLEMTPEQLAQLEAETPLPGMGAVNPNV